MSTHSIRCKKTGISLAAKLDGGECVCPPGECRIDTAHNFGDTLRKFANPFYAPGETHRSVPLEKLATIYTILPPPPMPVDGKMMRFEPPNAVDILYRIRDCFMELIENEPQEDVTTPVGYLTHIARATQTRPTPPEPQAATVDDVPNCGSENDYGAAGRMLAAKPEPQAAPDADREAIATDRPAYDAGMATAKRLMTAKHDFSPEYVGMAVVQDALAALRATPAQPDMRLRLAQLQASGVESLTIHQIVGLLGFCEAEAAPPAQHSGMVREALEMALNFIEASAAGLLGPHAPKSPEIIEHCRAALAAMGGERNEALEWAEGWHRTVETMMTIIGLSCAGSPSETLEDFTAWLAGLATPMPVERSDYGMAFENIKQIVWDLTREGTSEADAEKQADRIAAAIAPMLVALPVERGQETLESRELTAEEIQSMLDAILPQAALEQLRAHQQQLDQDGIMVGVSRQALEELLAVVLPNGAAPTPSASRVDRASVIEECAKEVEKFGIIASSEAVAKAIRALAAPQSQDQEKE